MVVTGLSGLRSGQVAAAAGVNLQTLRYYERRGLLAEPERTQGGHRVYPPETVTVLRVIKAAQRLGFSLDEVADLIDMGSHRHSGRSERMPEGSPLRVKDKLAEVEAKITDLGIIRDTLRAALGAGRNVRVTSADTPKVPLADLAWSDLSDSTVRAWSRGPRQQPRPDSSGTARAARRPDDQGVVELR